VEKPLAFLSEGFPGGFPKSLGLAAQGAQGLLYVYRREDLPSAVTNRHFVRAVPEPLGKALDLAPQA
jgi:hypothetical protein